MALKHLFGYGALGVITVLALLALRYKDRKLGEASERLVALQERHAETIATLQRDHAAALAEAGDEHQAQMLHMQERYIAKSETWMEKYQELARELKAIVKALAGRGQNVEG